MYRALSKLQTYNVYSYIVDINKFVVILYTKHYSTVFSSSVNEVSWWRVDILEVSLWTSKMKTHNKTAKFYSNTTS